jgi:glutaredoxin-like YruB-family protein
MTNDVTIYSATWCGFCHAAKEYLDKLGVNYKDLDVDSDPKYANDSVEKSGQRGIPVLDIAGDIIVGFDRPKIDAALKAHKIL